MCIRRENTRNTVDISLQKKACFENSEIVIRLRFVPTEKPCLVASCKVAYHIAKKKEPRTTGKTLVKPCILEMVEVMRSLEHTNETETLHVSNYVTHINR
jgi:hypothetical protein